MPPGPSQGAHRRSPPRAICCTVSLPSSAVDVRAEARHLAAGACLLWGDVRGAAGKRRQPSAGIIDRQSVKTTDQGASAALTPTHRSKAARGPSSSTQWDCCSPWSSPPPICKAAMAPTVSWISSSTHVRACGSCGPIRPMLALRSLAVRRCGGLGPNVWTSPSGPRAPRALQCVRHGGSWSGRGGGSIAPGV
jgi:hypothetical protein